MDFVIQWFWYLLAFVAGSAVAWVIARLTGAGRLNHVHWWLFALSFVMGSVSTLALIFVRSNVK